MKSSMNRRGLIALMVALLATSGASNNRGGEGASTSRFTFACARNNSLYQALDRETGSTPRYDSPQSAIDAAPEGSVVMILADDYPEGRTDVGEDVLKIARAKKLTLYVEYPASVPGVEFGEPRVAHWERGVVASDDIDLGLPNLHLLGLHECHFLPVDVKDAPLIMGRVAGFDTAVYGLPEEQFPLLFKADEHLVVATTKLSDFVAARYAPSADWIALWQHLLAELNGKPVPTLAAEPRVTPAFSQTESLPANAEEASLDALADWYKRSRLLLTPARREAITELLAQGVETTPPPASDAPGDGSHGILEGYASAILPDGSQLQRTPIRADCQAETAAVLALQGALRDDDASRRIATNLLDFLYITSDLCQGERGDPRHPAFGHIAWGTASPAWQVANYGDDNARTLLATIAAAAVLDSDAYDQAMLRALLANLRTTGKLGFRGDRIDMEPLEQNGWKSYHDQETINYSPAFEAYSWACYLWAYDKTKEPEFLEKAKTGIRMTMEAYPDGWRWGDHLDLARMLLALAWMVRVENTAEHRQWLKTVVNDLIKNQQACGAIPEELSGTMTGHFHAPPSNEAYGTTETPLLQSDGDPVTDQLYSTNFALIGLHEAAEATNDPEIRRAEDLLIEYAVRIQTRSKSIPYLDGTWFRAFDFRRWDYWSSSGDAGWGAWCAETGWGPAWNGITLGLRQRRTSLWDLTRDSRIADQLPTVRKLMAQNEGGPWTPDASK
jgi:hypothetical protein